MSDRLEVRYVPLDLAARWDHNKKRHDIGKLIESFERHGFKDPPKFEPALNGGSGGIVEGNGRYEALGAMRSDKRPAPRGIVVDGDGSWLVPVLFGVDAASERAAEAYGVDHNALTLSGGDFDLTDHMRLWDDGFEDLLKDLALGDELPVAFDGDDLDRLLNGTGVISHNGGERASSSPWERMDGDAASGVLFQFGAIVCRLSQVVYDAFLADCPESGIAQHLEELFQR